MECLEPVEVAHDIVLSNDESKLPEDAILLVDILERRSELHSVLVLNDLLSILSLASCHILDPGGAESVAVIVVKQVLILVSKFIPDNISIEAAFDLLVVVEP